MNTNSNDMTPQRIADTVKELVQPDASIAVLGLCDEDDSQILPHNLDVCRALHQHGFHVVCCEPNIESNEIDAFFNLSVEQAVDGADFIVILSSNKEFKENDKIIEEKPFFDCSKLED